MLITAGEVIQKSWQDYKANIHDWAIYSLIIFIPTFLLMLSGSIGGYIITYAPAVSVLTNLIILALYVVSFFFNFWSRIALIDAASNYLQTHATDHWKDHYKKALSRFWPAFGTSIFLVLTIGFGTLLFIIPGIIAAIYFYFAIFETVLSNRWGIDSMSESKKIVEKRWWQTAWLTLISVVVFTTIMYLIQYIVIQFFWFLPLGEETSALFNNIVAAILNSIFTPLITIAGLHIYWSLKTNPEPQTPPLP